MSGETEGVVELYRWMDGEMETDSAWKDGYWMDGKTDELTNNCMRGTRRSLRSLGAWAQGPLCFCCTEILVLCREEEPGPKFKFLASMQVQNVGWAPTFSVSASAQWGQSSLPASCAGLAPGSGDGKAQMTWERISGHRPL